MLITVAGKDCSGVLGVAWQFVDVRFEIKATLSTAEFLAENRVKSYLILKLHRASLIDDATKNGQIQLVINATMAKPASMTTPISGRRPSSTRCPTSPPSPLPPLQPRA